MDEDTTPTGAADLTLDDVVLGLDNLNERVTAVEQTTDLALQRLQPGIWPEADPDMAEWVSDWLIPTFRIGTRLGDWSTDPACTSDLAALHHAYQQAMNPKAGPFDPLRWHAELEAMLSRFDVYRQRSAGRAFHLPTAPGQP